jgi:2-amino-4-hydroxy-6-hydroxymethyldihydropteridine diphosphokinase
MLSCANLLNDKWSDVQFSSVYRSEAKEYEDQDSFLNAIAKIHTDESPETIYRYLHSIENALKKAPPFRFGPRTIDLDLLLYDNEILEEETLTIPHPRMHERRFVLEPLCELIEPTEKHPIIDKTWADLLEKTEDQQCEKVTDSLE